MKRDKQPDDLTILANIFAVWVLVIFIGSRFVGSHPDLWLVRCCGLYTRNYCGTYDRWITWDRGLRLPNGILGRDREACR